MSTRRSAPSLQFGFSDDASDDMSVRSLHDVPEEGPFSSTTPSSPYFESSASASASASVSASATASTSTLLPPAKSSKSSSGSRKTSTRSLTGRTSSDNLNGNATSRRTLSNASIGPSSKERGSARALAIPRPRSSPRLPVEKDAEEAPSAIMYWSRAPVYGVVPQRNMRGHTVNLLDNTAWVFGGCDDKDVVGDLYCFDIETMQWSRPETVGEAPPASRAHTCILVDKRLIVYGGGQGGTYYDAIYVFDIATRRWLRPTVSGEQPPQRRAHTAILYQKKIWVFGGGNGMTALNDVWTLDVANINQMRWEKVQTWGKKKPTPRGYHTANLSGHHMIIIGGSDGSDCFADIWFLNLETLEWTFIDLPETETFKRLSHSATQVGTYIFVQGGHDGAEYTSDIKCFSLVNLQYEHRTICGRPPSARGYHVCLLADSRLFFFGGYNGITAFDDVHIVDLAGSAFLPQVTSFEIDV